MTCICETRFHALLRYRFRSHLPSFRIVFVLLVFLLVTGTLANPASRNLYAATDYTQEPQGSLEIPKEYGEVVLQVNPLSNRQLYIIGISHRDPSSGANGTTTVEAQKEIYRIGEWLKKTGCFELLLPEGYFNSPGCSTGLNRRGSAENNPAEYAVDNAELEYELTAATFTNAEKLLMQHLGLPACQVENSSIYGAVRLSLERLRNADGGRSELRDAVKEIGYLQEVRTARLLQDIPGIIEDQFSRGGICRRSALLTIGLNHIQHILRYIENGRVDVATSLAGTADESLQSPLNLLSEGYGICIILPRSLADNTRLLQQTRIDRFLLANSNS